MVTPHIAQQSAPQQVPGLWRTAWRQAWRDWRSGELRLLVLAVVLAVAALTAVGFLVDRLQTGLSRDARQMLGGDLIVEGDRPLAEEFSSRAQQMNLRTAQTVRFLSMARASDQSGGASRLVAVKAVSTNYPVRGSLRLASTSEASKEVVTSSIPPRGQVWVDTSVLDALGLKTGDPLLLGDGVFKISAVIAYEPDRGGGFMNFAPRVMLNQADLAQTGLIQPASRATYRLQVAHPDFNDLQIETFSNWAQAWAQQQKLRGIEIESFKTGRPEMRQTLDRATQFLNLVALLTAILSAVAVAIAAHDFAQKRLDACALLRVLGLSQYRIAGQYALEFLAVGFLASGVGTLLGLGVHWVLIELLSGLLVVDLPPVRAWPALLGLGVGLTLLLGFGLPPVLQLAKVPALRVLRRDLGSIQSTSLSVLLLGLGGFVGLLLMISQDIKLGLITVGGVAAALAIFGLVSWGGLIVLKRIGLRAGLPQALSLGIRHMVSRTGSTLVQVSTLSLGLLSLLLLILLRTDLIDSWREATPENAPTRFVINIQPDQAAAFQKTLQQAGVTGYDWYPMVRGRLVAINQRAVSAADYTEDRAKNLVEREFNLSNSALLPNHNELVGGRWFNNEPHGLSVEAGLMERLGLKLGDELRFDVAGQTLQGRITSVRKVDWASMRANFFVLFPVAQLPDVPTTFLAAYRSPQGGALDRQIAREFSNVTPIDISASLRQVQSVLEQVIRAVEFLFLFSLLAGLTVLFATLISSREVRAHEIAVMRALGASRALLGSVLRFELISVGALAGFLAACAANFIGWALAYYVFEFAWSFSGLLLLGGTFGGGLLAWAAGYWGLSGILRRPVVQTLRAAL
jgi:putative ABC transport system permease protein